MTDSMHRTESEDVAGGVRRLRHPGRIVGLATVVGTLLVAAFIAGQLVRSPDEEALQNVDARVEVLASVEMRVVSNGFRLPAQAVPASTVDVFVSEASQEASAMAPAPHEEGTHKPVAQPKTERIVLSNVGVQPGATLTYGMLIAEVSGRPLFAWPHDDPLFRDLVPGDKGADVRAIQETLVGLDYYGVGVTGLFDGGTLEALRRLYATAGYSLPFVSDGVGGLAWREFVPLAGEQGLVVSVASVGTVLNSESALLRLQVSPPTLSVRSTAVELDALAPGTEVGVVAAGAQAVKSTVQAVGVFATDEATGASGYPVTIAIPEGVTIDGSTPVQVQPWTQPAPTLAVPAVAIRQEGRKVYVFVADQGPANSAGADAPQYERINVTVTAQSDGWVSIEPNEALPVGRAVLVSK